ncbi:unnamed protein product [Moneuplotes crassus]|uniref:Glutaredoxin domain-containing protein n=1 Tax=Euplotes crassus TaxID=5936 RepID=A0AAD1XZM2_EUPCR|nr:unnamed protein product [Moneuplotes crassus]
MYLRRIQNSSAKLSWANATRSFASTPSSDEDNESHDDFKSKNKQELSDYETTKTFLDNTIMKNDVVLFMKGTPVAPQCGFSNYVIQVFKFYNLKNYHSVNVLDSTQIREGVKKYSNWPTIPQLYVKQEFIGGCDIVKEMHMDGSLEDLLQKENLL